MNASRIPGTSGFPSGPPTPQERSPKPNIPEPGFIVKALVAFGGGVAVLSVAALSVAASLAITALCLNVIGDFDLSFRQIAGISLFATVVAAASRNTD